MKLFPLITTLVATSFRAASAAGCRCQLGQRCWPSSREIEAFGKTLSAPDVLLTGIRPPASVCHAEQYSESECTGVKALWTNAGWRSEQEGAMIDPVFESVGPYAANSTLVCDTSTPISQHCGQGEVPTLGVAAQEEHDIVKALDFAHRYNIRPVVKNTGHDFMGRSAGSDSLLVWTHRLQNATVDPYFVPKGCSKGEHQALRLGAGVQWKEAYKAIATVNRTVLGGISFNSTVGAAGGWLAGGGHSILSPTLGLGVDNVLQLRVVLPSADEPVYGDRIVDASACAHPDLFWALRGGGGGTFGVVTEVVYRSHDDYPGLAVTGGLATANFSIYRRLAHEFLKTTGTILVDEKWGGYGTATPSSTGYNISFSYYRAGVVPDSSTEKQLNKTMEEFFGRLQQIAASPSPAGTISRLPSFQVVLDLLDPASSGAGSAPAQIATHLRKRSDDQLSPPSTLGTSRLLPRSLFENSTALNEYLAALKGSSILTHNVLGGAVAQADPDAVGVHPGWRKNVLHVVTIPTDHITLAECNITTTKVTNIAYRHPADVASYLNEGVYEDKFWPESFFGRHWQRLSRLKRHIDPLDQLIVYRGVGSERWSDNLKCPKGIDSSLAGRKLQDAV